MEKASTDRQAANAALASLAAAGNNYALGQLWEANKGLIRRLYWQWYRTHTATAAAHGLTVDDLDQEGYFAVQYAAQTYTPEKGAFTTWLTVAVNRQVLQALSNGHRRNVACADGRTRQVSADPLNHCTSLDTPLDDEEGGATLGDLCADSAALADIQDVEGRLYAEQLHKAIDTALAKLTREEADVIRRRFYRWQSMPQIANDCGISCAEVYCISQRAMRKLRSDRALRRWYDEITPRYRGKADPPGEK